MSELVLMVFEKYTGRLAPVAGVKNYSGGYPVIVVVEAVVVKGEVPAETPKRILSVW